MYFWNGYLSSGSGWLLLHVLYSVCKCIETLGISVIVCWVCVCTRLRSGLGNGVACNRYVSNTIKIKKKQKNQHTKEAKKRFFNTNTTSSQKKKKGGKGRILTVLFISRANNIQKAVTTFFKSSKSSSPKGECLKEIFLAVRKRRKRRLIFSEIFPHMLDVYGSLDLVI